jgi:hypothetical protein
MLIRNIDEDKNRSCTGNDATPGPRKISCFFTKIEKLRVMGESIFEFIC